MKANEITAEDRKRWEINGWFPVICRICNEVVLYHKDHYNPKNFIGWECQECKRRGKICLN